MILETWQICTPFHVLFFYLNGDKKKNWPVEIGSFKVGHVLSFLFWLSSSGHLVTAGVTYSHAVLVNVVCP